MVILLTLGEEGRSFKQFKDFCYFWQQKIDGVLGTDNLLKKKNQGRQQVYYSSWECLINI